MELVGKRLEGGAGRKAFRGWGWGRVGGKKFPPKCIGLAYLYFKL